MFRYIGETKNVGEDIKKRIFDISIKTEFSLKIQDLMDMSGRDIDTLIKMINKNNRNKSGISQYNNEDD